MAITRWKPHDAVLRPFWNETWSPVTRMMEEFFNTAREGDMMVWGPNVDIVENPDGYEIYAELPGVKQEDVKITLDNNVLTLSGEKKQEIKEDRDNVLRVERSYGRFERSFSLPTTVKSDGVRASYEEGILRIQLPKAETAKARQIQIETQKK
jgi:HSP20 family protein